MKALNPNGQLDDGPRDSEVEVQGSNLIFPGAILRHNFEFSYFLYYIYQMRLIGWAADCPP